MINRNDIQTIEEKIQKYIDLGLGEEEIMLLTTSASRLTPEASLKAMLANERRFELIRLQNEEYVKNQGPKKSWLHQEEPLRESA